jgi:hypothetical protein
MLLRREEAPDEELKKQLSQFRDTQLERAVDALKGVMIYAQRRTEPKKPAAATN